MTKRGDGPGTGRALILVADPDVHVKRLERFFLESAGFEVAVVADGEEGLALARHLRPAIVITEILLPKRDGLSVCRALKSDESTRTICVLVLSVLAAQDRALEAGADAFLQKPLDDAKLVAAVNSLIGQRDKRG